MDNSKHAWESYKKSELEALTPILTEMKIALDAEQPHISGERYLMQAVTTASGRKLILLGTDAEGRRVVIKATRDPMGAAEIRHERVQRALLSKIRFAYGVFHSPEELAFVETRGFTISVQRFIEQAGPFLSRTLEDQFALALGAFRAQESAHAATFGHMRQVRKGFGTMDAKGYLSAFRSFMDEIREGHGDPETSDLIARAYDSLLEGERTIEQYTGFLTHTDFVPHNFKVVGDEIYLLDHSSIRFGNKHEGWARFLNFMALYNPELEAALTEYFRLNRAPEECRSLSLMRTYRLGEIIAYYVRTVPRSEGDLRRLNEARIGFWSRVLAAQLDGERVAPSEIDAYKSLRDSLRSDDEKRRQVGLH